jgi:5-oxoprolinase (ATP-hydrolysing) subunit A
MNKSIDINADIGECGGNDDILLPLASSVNIACGGHAGDEDTIRRTILAAMSAGITIGAHPGYDDRANFGRRPLTLDPDTLRESIVTQLIRFQHIAQEYGATTHHVKPHGALYNQANKDPELADLFIQCMKEILPTCALYCPPVGALSSAAVSSGVRIVAEGFADRRYQEDGSLAPRDISGSIITDVAEATSQALQIVLQGTVSTRSSQTVALPIQTLCVHGDSPHAIAVLQAIRTALLAEGIQIHRP